MPNQLKFLDFTGTQYLVNKIKAIDARIPTSQEINTMISNALEVFEQGLVTIVASLEDVTTPEEGKLYLVPDTNESSGDVYTVWAWEQVSGTYKWVQMGACTFTLVVDSALSDSSTNPVQNKVVKSALDSKASSTHIHGSITNDGKLSTASRVVVTDSNKNVDTSTVTSTELGYLSGVTSAIQTQINSKLDSSSLTSDISSGGTNAVTGGGVFTALAGKVNTSDIESISTSEIDVMFIVNGEIWIDATGWDTMNVLYDTNSQTAPGLALTKNAHGYYVFDISDLSTVDTFVISNTAGTSVTLQLATTLAGIQAYNGKIISVTSGSSTVTVLA